MHKLSMIACFRSSPLIAGTLFILLLSSPALTQQPLRTLLVGVDNRTVVSLNGDWHYLVDQPPARGLYNEQGMVREDGYAQNTHPNIYSGPHNAEYDFAAAPTLQVPGDWNTQEPTLFRFEGVVWYERDFEFQPTPGIRTFLHIGAANYRSFVWVNGKHICDHVGGFTPFDCEVTEAIHAGGNFVVVAVDSTRHQDDIPSVNYDWFNYGGITRDVLLITVPARFIDDYDVHLKHGLAFDPNEPAIAGYIHVEGAAGGDSVRLRIREAGVDATFETNASGRAQFDVKVKKLALWSTESPKLYKVELSTAADHLNDDIGFRDIRVEGTRILLNGKAVFLQGVNVHAEAPIRGGRVNNDQDVQNIFSLLKDLHANFVRLSHYPHDERMERMADREGIMVWSEIPLWQRISFDKPEVYTKAVSMLNEMIRRDRNKASVIFWSVSNETPCNPARTQFLTNLASEARRLDPTRLITSALIAPNTSREVIVQDDPLASALDVVGQNEYIGWYEGAAEDSDTKRWRFPEKPVIMSEFGAEATFGNHGGLHDRWAEEQQVNVFKHQIAMLREIPQLCGVAPWVLMDFRSPGRNIPKLQDGYNRKGLVDQTMRKKQAFFFFRNIYQDNELGKAK